MKRGRPFRLTIVMTHPVQYMSPWFRDLATHDDVDLMVLYAASPNAEQQGVGFGRAFEWDVPLTEGYPNRVLKRLDDARFDSESFLGVDVPEIKRALVETKPDYVMISGWHSVTQLRALWTCRKFDIPVLYRGDSNLDSGRSGLRRLAWRSKSRYLLSLFDAWLSVGERSLEYLTSLGCSPKRIFSSPHAVDNDVFFEGAKRWNDHTALEELRRTYGIEPGRFILLFVGKLTANKRPEDLIRAVAAMGSEFSLLIAGSGELLESCRELALSLGVSADFLGFVNQTRLLEAYACADVLVLPSAGETWGLVVNEALASGIPSIVSDRVGCAPDLVVAGETGEIFACGDAAALAAAIEKVRAWRGEKCAPLARCQALVSEYSYSSASAGLLAACDALGSEGDGRG